MRRAPRACGQPRVEDRELDERFPVGLQHARELGEEAQDELAPREMLQHQVADEHVRHGRDRQRAGAKEVTRQQQPSHGGRHDNPTRGQKWTAIPPRNDRGAPGVKCTSFTDGGRTPSTIPPRHASDRT